MQSVAVIDYGASNLRSVVKALEYVSQGRHKILLTDSPELIHSADKIVFPGQGAIKQCMDSLVHKGLDLVIKESIFKKPYLGLCLGLQALFDSSEEDGGTLGLGIIPGNVLRFPEASKDEYGEAYKIPHMGWNLVNHDKTHPMWDGISEAERFYFVHSYYVNPDNKEDVCGSTDYILPFTSVVARENLFAVQFHPEKSQKSGLQLLLNFLNWQ
jgi:glutamine amidotransferase